MIAKDGSNIFGLNGSLFRTLLLMEWMIGFMKSTAPKEKFFLVMVAMEKYRLRNITRA